jgi:hypothetical protein
MLAVLRPVPMARLAHPAASSAAAAAAAQMLPLARWWRPGLSPVT